MFQGLSGRIHAKLEYIKEQKEHGSDLVLRSVALEHHARSNKFRDNDNFEGQ